MFGGVNVRILTSKMPGESRDSLRKCFALRPQLLAYFLRKDSDVLARIGHVVPSTLPAAVHRLENDLIHTKIR